MPCAMVGQESHGKQEALVSPASGLCAEQEQRLACVVQLAFTCQKTRAKAAALAPDREPELGQHLCPTPPRGFRSLVPGRGRAGVPLCPQGLGAAGPDGGFLLFLHLPGTEGAVDECAAGVSCCCCCCRRRRRGMLLQRPHRGTQLLSWEELPLRLQAAVRHSCLTRHREWLEAHLAPCPSLLSLHRTQRTQGCQASKPWPRS